MGEYIEREALVHHFMTTRQYLTKELVMDAAYEVSKFPAADVAPAVHGRWVFDGSDFADIWKCSACGEDWYFEYDPRDAKTLVKFCPNCGARMDGGAANGI